ncbi:MAG: hypothetical protein KY476_22405 [Planctomycetes bacterium]|nr:hypothetical protein [Planctomycetota bacterium]
MYGIDFSQRMIIAAVLFASTTLAMVQASAPLAEQLRAIRSIGPEGRGGVEAGRAARELAQADPAALPEILAAFEDAGPLAVNYLRSAVETIADRAKKAQRPLPVGELEQFVGDRSNHPRARRLAYELLEDTDPPRAEKLLADMVDDPSAELRREAVQQRIDRAKELDEQAKAADGSKREQLLAKAEATWREAFAGAVDDDQVKEIVKPLERRGHKIDLQEHFGFIADWQIIGPFDNREKAGFQAAYPPEKEFDPEASYDGQLGRVAWQPVSTADPYGILDIAKELENYKGSCMYLTAEVVSPRQRDVQIRLGTPNAWKLWVNGEPVFGREEYHRGMKIDQYKVPAMLKAGSNRLLFKICQNEQKEDWAQRYQFQLRVTDEAGAAIDTAETPGPAAKSE